ncbi:MAG: lyase family protein [Gemmatimonadota bacterium]
MKPGTLWGTGAALDPAVFAYTVAADRPWDARLLEWDILGSLGHVEGLRAAGLLTASEQRRLSAGLRAALAAARAGELESGPADEDVHTAVEQWLTGRDPEAGPRLHAGRSRNEQVACDVRLYLKHHLLAIHGSAVGLAKALLAFAARHRSAVWPGYTHLRRAMPSSAGLWSAAWAEGVIETLEALPALWAQVDRSPLGTGAGYGVPVPLPRERVAKALGFRGVVTTAAAVQNGRGKLEAAALAWCAQLGHDAGRLASDAILYGSEEFGFLVLPGRLATGSSLMPQKRNPDVLELTRARAAALDGDLATVHHLKANLTGGYHRDYQLLKEPLMRGLDRTLEMTSMLAEIVPALGVDRGRARAALMDGILATDEVMRRVEEGAPFRSAYREVAAEVAEGARFPAPTVAELLARRRSTGGLGALGLDQLRARLRGCARWAAAERRRFDTAIRRLARP